MNLTGKRVEIVHSIRHWRDTPAAAMAHDMDDLRETWEEATDLLERPPWMYVAGVRIAIGSKAELKVQL